MRDLLRLAFLILATMLMVSCGGGGGGSSSAPSTPVTGGGVTTDTLRLSAGSINFSATEFEAAPDSIRVTATITGSNTAGITFGTLPGVAALPRWLDVQLGTLVNNSVDADFIITTIDQPAGNYSFTVRAVTFDDQQNVLNTADIDISYAVAEGIPLSVLPESVDVIMHSLSDPITQTISVTAGNYEWSAFGDTSNVDVQSATGSQDINLEIFPPFELENETGEFPGFVDVFQNETSNHALFTINYTLVSTLEYLGNDLLANAVAGSASQETVGVNLQGLDLNWQATSDVSWISFSETSGVITTPDDAVDSPSGDDFTITMDATNLDAGRHEGIITVTADAEQSLTIPVTVEVGAQILSSSRRGIALSQTPNSNVVQATVDIGTNAERLANWTASTAASWLSVTPSGTVNDMLVVTADPSSLANETTTEAIITLASPDAEIANTVEIRVGFWKTAMAPTETPVTVGGIFPEDLIVSDPVRPLAYVHSGEQEINIVNVYTGVVENTLTPSDRVLNFDVSDDGAFLYLVRSGDEEGFIDVVDLETQAITTTWSYPVERLFAGDTQDVGFGRITNQPYLFTSTEVVINALTGVVEPLVGGAFPASLMVRNNVFCSGADNGPESETAFGCFDMISAGFEGAALRSINRATATTMGGQALLSQSGDRVFLVADSDISVLETSDLSLIQSVPTDPDDFLENAELDSMDNLYLTYQNNGFVPTDPTEDMIDERRFLNIYDRDLTLVRDLDYPANNGGILPLLQATTLSGDDQRIVYLTDEGTLEVNFFSID